MRDQLLPRRRTVALFAAAAAISKSAQPTRAALAPYSLELPPGFVRLGNLGSRSSASGYLLVAGDFRDTIGAGSATTISVQRIDRQALPPLPTDAPGLAAALAQSRDKDTTNFEPSTVLIDTLCGPNCAWPRLNLAEQAGLPEPRTHTQQLDTGSCLQFEMLTSLVGGGGAASADPSLMRHTLVQAQVLPDALLVLWAGAQQTAWASGTGEVLKGAAATFATRAGPPS
jgi:hypothetical protein